MLGRNIRFGILIGVLVLVALAMACTNDDEPRSQFTPVPTDGKVSLGTTSGTTATLTNTTDADPTSDLVSTPNSPTEATSEITGKNHSQPLQPVIRLHYGGQVYDGVPGNFCWPREPGVSLCGDEGPYPWQDLGISAIPVTVGDSIIVEIEADDRPQKLRAAIFDEAAEHASDTAAQVIELAPGIKAPLAVDLPAGVYNMRISGQWEAGAQAYKFRLKVDVQGGKEKVRIFVE